MLFVRNEHAGVQIFLSHKHAGKNPIIPQHADAVMQPGKNYDGYWGGEDKAMQMEMAADIFNLRVN